MLVLEERRQVPHADPAILVDGHAEDGAAMFAKPRRIVRPATEQRDAKRGAADDHATLRAVGVGRLPVAPTMTLSAWAKLSGVPMSINVAPSAGTAPKLPGGALANTSRSSES